AFVEALRPARLRGLRVRLRAVDPRLPGTGDAPRARAHEALVGRARRLVEVRADADRAAGALAVPDPAALEPPQRGPASAAPGRPDLPLLLRGGDVARGRRRPELAPPRHRGDRGAHPGPLAAAARRPRPPHVPAAPTGADRRGAGARDRPSPRR